MIQASQRSATHANYVRGVAASEGRSARETRPGSAAAGRWLCCDEAPRPVSRVTDAPRPAGPPLRLRNLHLGPALAVVNPREQKVPLVLGLLWRDDLGQAEDEGHHKR